MTKTERERDWRRRHYEKNIAYYKAKAKKSRAKANKINQDHLFTYLSSRRCTDCDISDWRVLEFDHRDPGSKSFGIGQQLGSKCWATILKEIAKCDVVCANCHRIRTYMQRSAWRIISRPAESGVGTPTLDGECSTHSLEAITPV